MIALAKVGRHSLMAISLGRLLSSSELEAEEWREEVGDLFDRLVNI